MESSFLIFGNTRRRKEFHQMCGDTDRTGTGASASVRRGESLVKVDMHYVESHIAGTNLAEHRVQVGSVIIEKTSRIMNKLCNLHNLSLEHSESIGIGHHYTGYGIIEKGLEIFHID